MKRITSTEAARRFGRLMRAAQQKPVLIERLGHPRLVVISTRLRITVEAASTYKHKEATWYKRSGQSLQRNAGTCSGLKH